MANILMSWSGGKDSCLALYAIQQAHAHRVASLITTLTRDYDRISMHGVRRELLERQAAALGLPLHQVFIGKHATNEEYETSFGAALDHFRTRGIEEVAFGDLFLADIKTYRDQFLSRMGMRGIYPVWQWNTKQTIRQFIDLGFKAVVTCVDSRLLDQSFAGMTLDREFLDALPDNVDPCGENGEFHTFVFDGPNFSAPVGFALGANVLRDSFWFCDLLPV